MIWSSKNKAFDHCLETRVICGTAHDDIFKIPHDLEIIKKKSEMILDIS